MLSLTGQRDLAKVTEQVTDGEGLNLHELLIRSLYTQDCK